MKKDSYQRELEKLDLQKRQTTLIARWTIILGFLSLVVILIISILALVITNSMPPIPAVQIEPATAWLHERYGTSTPDQIIEDMTQRLDALSN